MKTIEEIKEKINSIFDEGVNFELYLGVGETKSRIYYRADFTDDSIETICGTYITDIKFFFENEDLGTLKLSELDQRASTLLFYDFDEKPAEFGVLPLIGKDPKNKLFFFADNSLSDVTALAIKISSAKNSVIFFKKFYPVSLVKRDQILLLPVGNRFAIVKNDILKISAGFEVMVLDDEFYINGYSKFEKTFDFETISNKSKSIVTASIVALNLVNDTKGYLASFQAPKTDILRAAKSPVLQMNAQTVINFALSKQAQIGLKVVGGRFELSSKASVKKLYKLLNDDYLTSGLTAFEYETLAKNKLA